jgi:hypothetical protein
MENRMRLDRVGLATIAVLAGLALGLRAADTCASALAGLPRGVRRCASLAEAKEHTGLDLAFLSRALDQEGLVAGEIRRTEARAVAVSVLGAADRRDRLTFFRSTHGDIPSTLRAPLAAFHELEVTLTPATTATLRAATMTDGSFWQDLEWSSGAGRTALRGPGRTVDLLRLARRLVEDAP